MEKETMNIFYETKGLTEYTYNFWDSCRLDHFEILLLEAKVHEFLKSNISELKKMDCLLGILICSVG